GSAFKHIATDMGKPWQPIRAELRPHTLREIVEAGHADRGCEDEREARRGHRDIEAGRERSSAFDIIEKIEVRHAVQCCAAIAEEGIRLLAHIRILQVYNMCAFNGEELLPVCKVRIDERAEFGDDARTP